MSFAQTDLNYVPVTPWTMAEEGTKRVDIVATNDKRQIIVVFCGSMTGDFLRLQLIYEEKTDRCLPQYDFNRYPQYDFNQYGMSHIQTTIGQTK